METRSFLNHKFYIMKKGAFLLLMTCFSSFNWALAQSYSGSVVVDNDDNGNGNIGGGSFEDGLMFGSPTSATGISSGRTITSVNWGGLNFFTGKTVRVRRVAISDVGLLNVGNLSNPNTDANLEVQATGSNTALRVFPITSDFTRSVSITAPSAKPGLIFNNATNKFDLRGNTDGLEFNKNGAATGVGARLVWNATYGVGFEVGNAYNAGLLSTYNTFIEKGLRANLLSANNVGIGLTAPTCALDISQGNLIANVARIKGLTTGPLVVIESFGSTVITPTRSGIFVNRTESGDPTTTGAEIHGQASGIITDALLFSAGNTTGINAQAIGGGNGTAKGVYAKGASGLNGISYGVDAQANGQDSKEAYGVKGYAWSNSNTATNIYGIYGTVAYTGSGAPALYAGYFAGDVYSTGAYYPSDRKLKKNIASLQYGIDEIMKLKPSSYDYNTSEYENLNLPEGKRYGFIADELEKVFPGLTKKAIHPAQTDENGNVISEAVEFTAVSYIELIPVLTKAIQEQQKLIEAQQKSIEDLLAKEDKKNDLNIGENIVSNGYLGQNVPNPFSTVTEIKYQLPVGTHKALIGVYDMNGKEIRQFQLGDAQSGSVFIQAGDLSAGMYLYSLVVDGKALSTKRMVLTTQ